MQPLDRRQALSLLHRAAKPELHHLRAGLLWLVLVAGLEAMGPILGKAYIDRYLMPHQGTWPDMAGLLGGALVMAWVASWVRYGQLIRLAGLAMRSVQRLREEVYGHVLRLPMAYFDRAITGQLVSRVTNDTEAVKALYVQVLFVMLDSIVALAAALVAMAYLDWHLMLVVALLVPAVTGIVWLYQRLSAPAVTRSRQLRSDLTAQMGESIAGMSVLQASNATPRFAERYANTANEQLQARRAELRANAWLLRPALDLLNISLLALVMMVFGLRSQGGSLSAVEIGVLYAFISTMARVVEPLIQITTQFSQLQQSMVAAARVNTLLQESESLRASGQGRVTQGGIDIRHLTFGYASNPPVLHDVSLRVAPGQFIGIVGHTGSGKSTLLSLMLRFYQATPGMVMIDGQNVDDIDDHAFRQAVGLVPQEPFLLAASARENIDMGRGLSAQQIEDAAKAAQVHDFILTLEKGYDTPLGEGGARLSVGQKQLLAMARALAGQPRILFLDEATSHIDSDTERLVQKALDALHGQVTVVAIAHRLSTIRDADAIVVLHHGRIAEQGAHEALMALPEGRYQRLYLLQQWQAQEAAP
ncbi:ABC transporter ATP-binding protein [Aquabacterium sp.]|uniref:ABC transporter ATP-binding protein n=1 Tax=Aquabacterium sp. TaxID=1872578 RepID=UPI003D6D9BFC